MLLPPRQPAQPRVHEVPVQVPAAGVPVLQLVEENRRRGRDQPEYELLDTGIFDDDRYFDVFIEYAKAGTDDVLVRISAANRGSESALLHLLPTLWFRNHWSWFADADRPQIGLDGERALKAAPREGAPMWLYFEAGAEPLFTDNDSNGARLWGLPRSGFAKDGFDEHLVQGDAAAVNPNRTGTKAALHVQRRVAAGETWVLKLRLSDQPGLDDALGAGFDACFDLRQREADAFYRRVTPFDMPDDLRNVQRQAFAGLLWSKQFYHYTVEHWLQGDFVGPPPPASRLRGRNHEWRHLCRRRRAADARQVGVPVVRRLGHGLPLRGAGADRPGLRQAAADPADARVVHASERPAAGLRVGVRRT